MLCVTDKLGGHFAASVPHASGGLVGVLVQECELLVHGQINGTTTVQRACHGSTVAAFCCDLVPRVSICSVFNWRLWVMLLCLLVGHTRK
jgi:hypothetical protein